MRSLSSAVGLLVMAAVAGCDGTAPSRASPAGENGAERSEIPADANDASVTDATFTDANDAAPTDAGMFGCADALCDDTGAPDAFGPCEEFAEALSDQLLPTVQQNLACTEDSDCVWTISDFDGSCVTACGFLSNEAGIALVESAASSLCQPFLARGCTPLSLECPYSGPVFCAAGTCAAYRFGLEPVGTFTHGVCTALQLVYAPSYGTGASSDFVLSMTPTNATLYSDPGCTMPLTSGSLTIPPGEGIIPFGFMPTAPGATSLELSSFDMTLLSETAQ